MTTNMIRSNSSSCCHAQVAMKALKNVHPVTHAIGNTLRRVIIMLVCIIVFRTPMSLPGLIGSAFAIGGSSCCACCRCLPSLRACDGEDELLHLTSYM